MGNVFSEYTNKRTSYIYGMMQPKNRNTAKQKRAAKRRRNRR